jgi:hypothetical protein
MAEQEQTKTAIKVEQMTDIELLEDRLEHIESFVGTIYGTTYMIFQERDKARDQEETMATSTLILLTSMGAHAAAIQCIVNKLKVQIEVLKDLESEEKDDSK